MTRRQPELGLLVILVTCVPFWTAIIWAVAHWKIDLESIMDRIADILAAITPDVPSGWIALALILSVLVALGLFALAYRSVHGSGEKR